MSAGEDDADDDHGELVLERRPRVGAEEGAGDDGQSVEEPEAEDRLHRERPVAEPRLAATGGGIMSIGTVMSQNSCRANRRLPVGRSAAAAGRNEVDVTERRCRIRSFPGGNGKRWRSCCECRDKDKQTAPPPPVFSAPPERDLERKLKRNPDDPERSRPTSAATNRWTRRTHRRRLSPGRSRRAGAVVGLSRIDVNGAVTKTHRRCKKSTIHSFPAPRQFLA